MKKYLVVFLFICGFKPAQSQVVFCPPGAEWRYLFTSPYVYFAQPYYNERITYVKDSLLGQDVVKVLNYTRYFANNNFVTSASSFIKQRGDTVFMRGAATNNTWQILYNYSALAGQSWTTTVNTPYNVGATLTYTIVVDSVAIVNINNVPLKRLYVKYKKPGTAFEQVTHITERIGCQKFMFNYISPNAGSDPDRAIGCICYKDSVFTQTQFTSWPCDYNNPLAINENNNFGNTIKVYPNPVNNYLIIDDEDNGVLNGSDLIISDLTGRVILEQKITGQLQKYNLPEIEPGVYLIFVRKNNELLYTRKFIKSN